PSAGVQRGGGLRRRGGWACDAAEWGAPTPPRPGRGTLESASPRARHTGERVAPGAGSTGERLPCPGSPFLQRLAINVNTQPSGQNAVFGWSFLVLTSEKPARSSSSTISFGK